MPEGTPNVIRGAASVTVVVAVSRTMRFRNAEVVFARVATGEATGRALHKMVFSPNWPLVRQRYMLVNIERLLRSAATSGEASRG
jgi:hypothetical protein